MAGDSSPPELPVAREVVPGKGVLRRDVGQAGGTGPRAQRVWGLGNPPALSSATPHSADWPFLSAPEAGGGLHCRQACASLEALSAPPGGGPPWPKWSDATLSQSVGPPCVEEVVF